MKRDGFAVYTSSPRAALTFDLIIIIIFLEKAALHMAGFKIIAFGLKCNNVIPTS